MQTQVLDCTLRDGGYYVSWDFDSNLVRKYLAAIAIARVDIVEIGFRLLSQECFLGAYAYSTDDHIKSLSIPDSIKVAVMINAKELLEHEVGPEEVVKRLFSNKKCSPVDIVRIAVHAHDVDRCYPIANTISELGYSVFINLMQVDAIEDEKVTNIGRAVSDWNCVDVLYFADSFGSMDPNSVQAFVKALKKGWDGQIGVHTHDNKGQALLNSLSGVACGINYLDATILGMGRGAGNAKTENLLVEMSQRGQGEYFPDALFPLVLQDFKVLQKNYGWGPNIYYHLSAVHGIHPTYIQEMLGDERYGTEQILSAINFLKSTRAPFYNFENMLRAISGLAGSEIGAWKATDWLKGQDVLIIGSGPSTKRYVGAIQNFVNKRNPAVLCLNINESVPKEMVTAYVACHETRILIECDHYTGLNKPLILPLSRVPDAIREAMNGAEILDYGLRVEESRFSIGEMGCVLNSPLALMYAISVATAAGAKQIFLSGIDGYEASDPRQKEVVTALELFSEINSAESICAITPTTFPIIQRSLYDPNL